MGGLRTTFDKVTSKKSLQKNLDPARLSEGRVELSSDKLEDSFANPLVPMKETVDNFSETFEPDIPIPEEEAIIPLPDERMQALQARKRRARTSRTGRDSTILTEALGG